MMPGIERSNTTADDEKEAFIFERLMTIIETDGQSTQMKRLLFTDRSRLDTNTDIHWIYIPSPSPGVRETNRS